MATQSLLFHDANSNVANIPSVGSGTNIITPDLSTSGGAFVSLKRDRAYSITNTHTGNIRWAWSTSGTTAPGALGDMLPRETISFGHTQGGDGDLWLYFEQGGSVRVIEW